MSKDAKQAQQAADVLSERSGAVASSVDAHAGAARASAVATMSASDASAKQANANVPASKAACAEDERAPKAASAQASRAQTAQAAAANHRTADGSAAANHHAPSQHAKKSRFRTARGWVVLACVVFVLVGMAFHVGIGTPSAFGIQQISAICPLGALETMAGAKGVMLHPLLLFALVVVLIVLVGKAFCAWMCPVPWLQKFFRPSKRNKDAATQGAHEVERSGQSDTPSCAAEESNDGLSAARPAASDSAASAAKSAASQKRGSCAPSACSACAGATACAKALAPVGGARDGVQLDSRHAVLVGTLASAAVFGFPVFCLICPVGLTFATIIGLWNLVQFNEPTWALIIFPIILILEVTVLRKWCSKICPISALVSLLANLNVTLRPRVKADACLRSRGVDCHACVDACPEQLDPHTGRIPECSKCGKCVEACPAKAISIKLLK